MTSVERGPLQGTELDSLELRYMEVLKAALKKVAEAVYMGEGIKGLKGAAPEDQRKVVEMAFEEAHKGYAALGYPRKQSQLLRTREAYNEGRLELTGLLQGLKLEATPKDSRMQSLLSRLRGILGRGSKNS